MPGNYIYVSHASSVRFVRINPPVNPQYNLVHFDQDWFINTIRPWETEVNYAQKWQQADTVFFQVLANYNPIKVDLIDCQQRVIKSVDLVLTPTAIVGQPYGVYEGNMQLAEVPEGLYYFVLQGGFGELVQKMVSEPQDIRFKHEDTLLIEYWNSYNMSSIVWDTGIKMRFRVDGTIGGFQPGSDDTLFIDQPHNVVLLDSTPFRLFKLYAGGSYGLPDWAIDKLNRIVSFDNTLYDGKAFVKSEGAKWEKTEGPLNYPMNGWSLDINEVLNRDFEVFDDTFDDEVELTFNIFTDLFGSFPPGDGTISIITNE